ncbi:MOB kinase activator 2a isoform X3 [Trichomycterus rosablanca]|uniref:MOB kinase activator 2a isoform X3 n=1 Tax=Trichomycterus rosablanca TaxID=2290929 RepID=UPI002F35CADB
MGVLVCCDCFFYRKSKTKPNGKKPTAEEKKHYLEPEYTKVRVVDFDLKDLVVLPREIDLNEWLSSNTTTFFNLINLQYSTISEFCTGDTCQSMAACNTTYYWYDEKGKKIKCTAPQYVDFVMSLAQKLVTDEEIFPTKYGDLLGTLVYSTSQKKKKVSGWHLTVQTRSAIQTRMKQINEVCSFNIM